MANWLDSSTRVVRAGPHRQGKDSSTPRSAADYGTKIVAGNDPGKGAMAVDARARFQHRGGRESGEPAAPRRSFSCHRSRPPTRSSRPRTRHRADRLHHRGESPHRDEVIVQHAPHEGRAPDWPELPWDSRRANGQGALGFHCPGPTSHKRREKAGSGAFFGMVPPFFSCG